MHLKSYNGTITEVHLEDWDAKSLPDETREVLEELEGQDETYALSILFTERVFLYTKHCFVLRGDSEPPLIMWLKSHLHNDDISMIMNMMTKVNAHTAIFVRESFETNPDSIFVITEAVLAPYKLEPETVYVATDGGMMNKDDNPAIDLFGIFNLARNGFNQINNYTAKSNHTTKAKYTKNSSVIYSELGGVIRIKQPDYILQISDLEIKNKISSVFLLKEVEGQDKLKIVASRVKKLLGSTPKTKHKKFLGLF